MNAKKRLGNAVILIGFMVPLLVPLTGFHASPHEPIIQRKPVPVHNSLIVVGDERFVDNGDGTVTDTRRQIMWQKGDNGKEVTFEEAQQYCETLRLGGYTGYTDWRLPEPDERDTEVVIKLMMPIHSRTVHAHFDLYWSSDPTVWLPFDYHPSLGGEVSRVYEVEKGASAFVRCVRSLGGAKPGGGS